MATVDSVVRWTPALGAHRAADRLGDDEAIRQLCAVLVGKVAGADLCREPWRYLLRDIADVDPEWVIESEARSYWPRAWAGRALWYVGDDSAVHELSQAVEDRHWRVRMNSVRALGRVRDLRGEETLVRARQDEHHRVRSAVATALGSLGGETSFSTLRGLMSDPSREVRVRAEAALERLVGSE